MSTDATQPLPSDPDQFRQLLDERDKRIAALQHQAAQLELDKQQLQLDKLRLEQQLLLLRKRYYGPRADALSSNSDIAQMLLEFAVELEARPIDPADLPPEQAAAPIDPATIRRVRKGRRNLADFDKLEVIRKVHDLNESQRCCPCCNNPRVKIGEETTWQIEYIPASFVRIENVQIKYACKHCEQQALNPQITLADKPRPPIDKGMAGPGLLAYVVTSKYADYLPLYRLENIFARNGFEIDRATQSIWCADVARIVSPLYNLMVQRVLASHVVATDDTVMPMLAVGKTKPARMWVYVGDQDHPYNVFDFTLSRSRDGPGQFLAGYNQVLLADGYGGYDGVVVAGAIIRAGCWAHARRKFVDAEKTEPRIATEAVAFIRQLYAIEDKAKDMDAMQRLALRREQSQPILQSLHDKLLAWKQRLLPRHPMSEAVGYALNQWQELNVFVNDGSVLIDNNISERQMKRIVLNRKNSLFVGNENAGRTAAILSSITSSCQRHEIDPQRYLTQLLTNMPGTPTSRLAQWLPDAWKKNQAALPGVGLA